MTSRDLKQFWRFSDNQLTPQADYLNRKQWRRDFLKSMGAMAGIGTSSLLLGCQPPKKTDLTPPESGSTTAKPAVDVPEVKRSGPLKPDLPEEEIARYLPGAYQEGYQPYFETYPADRNAQFTYGRPETEEVEAAKYANFYEFSLYKSVYRNVGAFTPVPWSVVVDGECEKPTTFDLDDLYSLFPIEERAYRLRCVETWAACVPWTGFMLKHLLKKVEPKASAKFVRFETMDRPHEAPVRGSDSNWPWPYIEGLTIDEAMNDLTMMALGIYGHPLPNQHGAPFRLVVPWKYGFKNIKSIVRITLSKTQPPTFWNTAVPSEYKFEANVEPEVPHPRWSQASERMLGTGEVYETLKFNGYGDYVASLYS